MLKNFEKGYVWKERKKLKKLLLIAGKIIVQNFSQNIGGKKIGAV